MEPPSTTITCVEDSVGHGVQASGVDSARGSPAPGSSTGQGYSTAEPHPLIHQTLNDYLDKPKIKAAEYRVLIPRMFKALLHPNSGFTEAKVKSIWNPENRPNDWPETVKFRDPNNKPKFKKRESELVYRCLRDRLRQDQKYSTCLRQPIKPRTKRRKLPSPRTAETCHHVVPNLSIWNQGHLPTLFEVHRESIGIQEEGADIRPVLPQIPQLQMPSQYASAGRPISTFVGQMEEGMGAKTGVVNIQEPLQRPLPPQASNQYCLDEGVLSSMQPRVVEIVSSDRAENEGQTSLTLFQTAAVPCEAQMPSFPTEAQQQSNVMYVYRDEHSTQPVNPQACEIQLIPGTPQYVQTSLVPIVTEFSKIYQTEPSIMKKVEEVIEAAERNFKANVPEANYGCQVTTMLDDTDPTLMIETNSYVPTIAGLEPEQQKRPMLEKNPESVDYVDSENQDITLMETDTEQNIVDSTQYCGIKLRDGEYAFYQIHVVPDVLENEAVDNMMAAAHSNFGGSVPSETPPTAEDDMIPDEVLSLYLDRMPVDTNALENEAVDNMMAAAHAHFGRSVTSETPPTAEDDMIPDGVLSLEYSPGGTSPCSDVPWTIAKPPAKIELPTSTETIFAYLKSRSSSVIPTTVFEALADQGGKEVNLGKQSRRF